MNVYGVVLKVTLTSGNCLIYLYLEVFSDAPLSALAQRFASTTRSSREAGEIAGVMFLIRVEGAESDLIGKASTSMGKHWPFAQTPKIT